MDIGKILITIGAILLVLGLILKLQPLSLGRLPGDILIKKKNFTFYFPLATAIILSVIVSIIVTIIRKI